MNNKQEQAKAYVRLHLTGFEQQTIIGVNELANIIKTLPSFHLTGLNKIEFDPTRFSQKSVGYFLPPRVATPLPNLNSHAEYIQEKQIIMIYKYETKAELLHILFHEIGHHVYHNAIDGSQKQLWVTKIHPQNHQTTDYGTRNASEDFAETYSLYVSQPNKLHRIAEKYAFMRNVVFKGQRPQIEL